MTLPCLGESRGEIHQLVWEPSSIMTADATLVVGGGGGDCPSEGGGNDLNSNVSPPPVTLLN